ncbi:MAG: hypothetical protein MHM6MM_001687 [Cercozoa sp. M6MM]
MRRSSFSWLRMASNSRCRNASRQSGFSQARRADHSLPSGIPGRDFVMLFPTEPSFVVRRFNGKYLQLYRFNNPEIEISRHNISFMKPHLELVLQDGRKVQFVLPEALDDVDKMQRELRQHLSQIDSNLDDLENNLPENWVLNADMTPEVPPPEKLEEMRQHRLKTLEKQKEQRKRLLAEEAKKAAEMEELQKLRAEEEARLAQEAALEKARKQREQLDAAVQQRRAAREVE